MAVLVALLVIGLAGPAGAATPLQLQQATHAKRIQVLGRINALKATDAQLSGAVTTLDTEVGAQLSVANAALAAVRVALQRQADADAAVRSTEARITALRASVVRKAIEQYMEPAGSTSALFGTSSLAELGQRSMYLAEVAGKGGDVLDQLRVARADLLVAQKAATSARTAADQRQRAANDALTELELARSVKQRLQSALVARIAAYQGEAQGLAAQEGNLEAFIRAQESTTVLASRTGVSNQGFMWPLSGPITSPFGPRWGGFHPGIDIGVPIGTPIHASKAGTVIYASWMGGYGYVVIIDHGGGFSTLYAHQSRITSTVGEQVAQGQVIGYSGNTGYTTGPHLHFEIRVNSIPQNPLNYLP